jgi:hypothetical protein
MINFTDLSTTQLKNIIAIKEQIEELQSRLDSIVSGNGYPSSTIVGKRRRRMSAAGRARIVAAVKARWARYKRKSGSSAKGASAKMKMRKKRDRRSSPAVRARLAAAAKARWARAKAAGKSTL